MAGDVAFRLLQLGMEAADRGDTLRALPQLEQAVRLNPTPLGRSYLAYCRACEAGTTAYAVAAIQRALAEEPDNPLHHLNLGRVYLLLDRKAEALAIFREGLRRRRHPQLLEQLQQLGIRRPPLFGFLPRKHPLNRMLGRAVGWLRPLPAP